MTLDLTETAGQIEHLAAHLKSAREEKDRKLDRTVALLRSRSGDWQSWQEKIASASTTWLVAGLDEDPTQHSPAPPCPQDYAVLACDGSHIDVDRNYSARCFLINLGAVRLEYGQNPDAGLASLPRLYFRPEEVGITSPDGSVVQRLEGPILGVKRAIEECRLLCQQAAEVSGLPCLALLDGSLVLFGLAGQTYPDYVVSELLDRGFLACLNDFKEQARQKKLALASYISYPRAAELVNDLRIALCPNSVVDCDRCLKSHEQKCQDADGLLDRELMAHLLAPGERSAIFQSYSSVVKNHYGEHQVKFFYIRLDSEIARVEVPGWVVESGLVDLVHSTLLEQCDRGHGYPVALSEAHEQAVVTGADRQQFWRLVDEAVLGEGMELATSAKSQSKRLRWL